MNVIPAEPRRNNTDILARWMPVFPSRTTRKLRYSSSFYLAGTSGVVATNVLSANGLYDPEITGTGHQPMGFDQLMLSYNHYTVTQARLICTFHNLAATSSVVSVKVDGGSTPITVVDQILEWGLNNHSVLEAKGTYGSVKVVESKVSIARFEGVSDVLDVQELRGSVAANPAEQTYFHVQSWDNAGVTTNILTEIVLEYTAVFTEPRVLSESLVSQLSRMMITEEKRSQGPQPCRSSRVT
jgi:hypothetical protein